jgi:flagellar hook-length control protein FliK
MSAINKLLPIAPAGSTHATASRPAPGRELGQAANANEIAAARVSAGGYEPAKDSPEKGFAQAYEDRLSAQRDASDQHKKPLPSSHPDLQSEDRALPLDALASGDTLPLEGGPLPPSEINAAQEQTVLETINPAPEVLVMPTSEAGLVGLVALSSPKGDAMPITLDSVFEPEGGIVSVPISANSDGTNSETTLGGLALGADPAVASQQSVLDGDSAQPETIPSVNVKATLQSSQSLALEMAAVDAEFTWQGELIDRVKAWRGIVAQESLGAGNLQNRQEMTLSLNSSQGSQLQQFAQSIRASINLVESQLLAAGGGERQSNSTSVMTSTESFSAWRADNLQSPAVNVSARAAVGGVGFAQTMQASNFGMPLESSFGQNSWGESVSQRVSLMAGQKISTASIALDPPELGAMTVKVSVDGDQASVSFLSAHAQVREALEHTFSRLQDLLSQQGLQLVDAQVEDDPAARQQSGNGSSGQDAQRQNSAEDDARLQSEVKALVGLIDYYV